MNRTTITPAAPLSRRRALGGLSALAGLALGAAACGSDSSGSTTSPSSGTREVKLVLGWYADAEAGGWYAADGQGHYADKKLSVAITPGGPQVSQTQLVASGRADFGITDAATIVNARASGIPVVAVAAMYQDNPVGVMAHADSGAKGWADLSGRTWYVQTGQLGQQWAQQKYDLKFTTAAYNGSIAAFIADDRAVQQGWPTNEVYTAMQQGVETSFFSYASSGFNPYNDVLFTTEDYLSKNPQVVTDVLDAAMHGWADYLGDIAVATTTNEGLIKANPDLDPKTNWFAWDKQRQFIVAGDGAAGLGTVSLERWSTLVDQMKELGALTEDVDAAKVVNIGHLPAVPAPTTLPPAPTGSY